MIVLEKSLSMKHRAFFWDACLCLCMPERVTGTL